MTEKSINHSTEDGREENKNKVEKVIKKKAEIADLLKKVKEMEKEKNRFQDMFEEGKIKYKLEKERMLDQMKKLKEERDKFANIVNLVKRPEILIEERDQVFINDQGEISVNDKTNNVEGNNNITVSNSVNSVTEIVTETTMDGSVTETIMDASTNTEDGQEFSTGYQAVLESPTQSETILESLSGQRSTTKKILGLQLDQSTTENIETVEAEDETGLLNQKLKLRLDENDKEKVKSAELVNTIGDDGVTAGSSIIAVTEIIDELLEDSFKWNPISMENVTEVNLEETCKPENTLTVNVGDCDVTEDTFLVGRGEDGTDSRHSYTENKREAAEVKKQVQKVIPEKNNYSMEVNADCPNNFPVKQKKRKHSDVTEIVIDHKDNKSNVTAVVKDDNKMKSDEEKKRKKMDGITVQDKKEDESLDDGVLSGSSIIAVTENSVFIESVTEVQLEETCESENTSTVNVGECKVTEDTSQGGGGDENDSLSCIENKREIAEVKKKVEIVIPEKEKGSIKATIDSPSAFPVEYKKSEKIMVVKDHKNKKSKGIVIIKDKKNKSYVATSFEEKKRKKKDLGITVKDKKEHKSDADKIEKKKRPSMTWPSYAVEIKDIKQKKSVNTVDTSMSPASKAIVTKSNDPYERMMKVLAEKNDPMTFRTVASGNRISRQKNKFKISKSHPKSDPSLNLKETMMDNDLVMSVKQKGKCMRGKLRGQ